MPARRWLALGGVLVVAVVAAAAFGAWYFFIRDDAPPPVNLADAVSAAQRSATGTSTQTAAATSATPDSSTATAAATSDATATTTGASQASGADSLVGQWQVADGSDSFVGYRVEEQLANIGANTAVGRTSAVTGTLTFDGSAITEVQIEADLTQLQSDDSRRDRQLQRQGIQTDTFPTANFTLTQPIAIDHIPSEGEQISATAVGDLTLHGVTRSVSIPLEGQLTNDLVAVVGSLDINFADFDIEPPESFSVLSIADPGTMEFQLIFERA